MAEREPTPAGTAEQRQAMDLAAIASTLGVAPDRTGESTPVTFVLRNEPLNLSLRLTIDRSRSAVTLYLRGPTAFLGFVHLAPIEDVRLDAAKNQVAFMGAIGAAGKATLKVERAGVFTLTSTTEPEPSPAARGGEPDRAIT